MKKLTNKYWNTLEKGSKRRCLTCVFPLHKPIVDMLMDEKPNKKESFWQIVFKKVRIPEPDERGFRHYKTVVNKTYIP